MATGYKRLSRKARHLIHRLRREKHASVQRTMVHELGHEINRHWGSRRRPGPAQAGVPGNFRPLTHRAKQILTRLRKTRVWSVQKRLVAELRREMEKRVRVMRRAQVKAQRAARVAAKAGRDGRRAGMAAARKAGAGAREAARIGRAAARKARPAARKARVVARTARARLGRPPRRPARARGTAPRPRSVPRAVPVRQRPARRAVAPRAAQPRVPRARSARP